MGIEIPVLNILQSGVIMFTHRKFINHTMDALLCGTWLPWCSLRKEWKLIFEMKSPCFSLLLSPPCFQLPFAQLTWSAFPPFSFSNEIHTWVEKDACFLLGAYDFQFTLLHSSQLWREKCGRMLLALHEMLVSVAEVKISSYFYWFCHF